MPDETAALEMLKVAGCSERVVRHCQLVSFHAVDIAKRLKSKGYQVDVGLVRIGGLLHDMGRSKTHSLHHGVEGAGLARGFGLNPKIVRIIETHIGAGIPADEAHLNGLPDGDYIPSTLEEKIVAHADNLIEDDHLVTIEEKVVILAKKKRPDKIVRKIVELNDEIEKMLKL